MSVSFGVMKLSVFAFKPSSASAAHAVNVVLDGLGHVVVDDEGDTWTSMPWLATSVATRISYWPVLKPSSACEQLECSVAGGLNSFVGRSVAMGSAVFLPTEYLVRIRTNKQLTLIGNYL